MGALCSSDTTEDDDYEFLSGPLSRGESHVQVERPTPNRDENSHENIIEIARRKFISCASLRHGGSAGNEAESDPQRFQKL